jgi:hypothetical protein
MLPAIAATTVNPIQMYRMVENGIMGFTFTVTSLAWRHRWRPVPAEALINAILPDNPGAEGITAGTGITARTGSTASP